MFGDETEIVVRKIKAFFREKKAIWKDKILHIIKREVERG